MTDRDSFIAAIAATPTDDLPRLVFADWLDENGDGDRAAFIRAQVGLRAKGLMYPDEALFNTSDDLFHANGEKWYTPFLAALGADVSQYHVSTGGSGWRVRADGTQVRLLGGGSIRLDLTLRADTSSIAGSLTYEGGFVSDLHLPPPASLIDCSFAEALRLEPVTKLTVPFARSSAATDWTRISDPSLRRIRELSVTFVGSEDGAAPLVLCELFQDLHLAGVRKFDLVNGTWFGGASTSPEILRELGRSRLAYRLNDLRLIDVTEAGIRAMCHNREFHWKQLDLNGSFGPTTPARLADTGLTNSLMSLSLDGRLSDDPDLGDRGVAALAARQWVKLTELALRANGITSTGLLALANASFTPYLEVLDLSDNRQLVEDDDLDGLRELAAAVNPASLRLLVLRNTGLTAVPDFLESQFGDRVIV